MNTTWKNKAGKVAKVACISILAGYSFSCGPADIQYVEKFEYDIADNRLDMGVLFNSDFTLNTEITIPIKKYGSVSLVPSNGAQGFGIRTELNLDVLLDPEMMMLERTRRLPSGERMSSYVTTDVARLWIKANDQVATSVYFGLEEDYNYIGTTVELGFMGKDFPAGLVLGQRIRDHKNRQLGVVEIYGPKLDGDKVIAPGGIFIITNASDLMKYIKEAISQPKEFAKSAIPSGDLIYHDPTEVNDPLYKDQFKQLTIFNIFKEKGKKAGLLN